MIYHRKISAEWHYLKYMPLYLLIICPLSEFRVSAQNDTTSARKQKEGNHKQEISLFGSDEVLNVSLYFDLEGFLKKKSKTESFDAEMVIRPGEKDSINKSIKIKYRGIIRGEICSFPPIEINFNKLLYADSGKIRKLKLVTHCEPGSRTDEYVIREYLVYKLFNAITDTSLRVRLLKVNYTDSKKNKKTIVKYGIIIEPVEMLAKRTNTIVVKTTTLNQTHIVPEIMDRLAIFNYMVANWDWSVPGQHNVKIIKPLNSTSGSLGIVIPYDFDLTGVVNADYAIPPPNVNIENVRERIYSGLCRTKEVYIKDLSEFINRREMIYAAVNNCPGLNQRSKKDITNYLDGFFDQLDKPKDRERLMEKFAMTCKY
jgi:hypothetical protein